MENITIGQIISIITTLTIIGGFVATIIGWWKSKITNRFTSIEKRLNYVESKRDEYEAVAENSNCERMILMEGLLAALKGLHEMGCNDAVTTSIKRIEDYMMKKTHGQEGSL